ncbi:LexA family protein [Vibrio parahaemolyticus]|uniref:Translesion error-prone DNA polymerase V autoproteolytic subunit n=1 Tax=Vibrio alginolyticus TaxID=663 RepID=A0A7Y4B5R1_VIBAL|nr:MULTISPECIES: translesion error-prone DNA polymerase V autoproteolytic subunit [Vibrio harveyi group]HAS6253022.1 translesion error-prone DNA polymerase V autoproteolytic subunit [Vibrio vulnificus]AHJ02690.1 Error-prone repair protein UmuD [Vibrio parahaemolyticus UCM-V493]ANZ13255.1 DNA polymerase V subunit [Vibrio parahaemolyticus]APX10178.1 DNA polymerase V [Vibrio campbellii]EGQ8229669.1 translesion error-prone DNA polymerase V autoproteolytic subunit [Vibrio parahaemolyticus]
MRVIPIPASAGITGFESPASQYTQLDLDLDALLVEHPSSTFFGTACGDSMQGVGIYDGDILIVDRAIQVQNGDIVVCNLNGEFVCKKIDIHRRLLMSANENFRPVFINECDTFTTEGVVIRSIRCHRPSHLL